MRKAAKGAGLASAIHRKVISIVQAKSCGLIDVGRATKSFGRNAERLIKAKRHYDPDNVFRSAIPLPVGGISNHLKFKALDYPTMPAGKR